MHNFNQLDQDVHCPLCPQKKNAPAVSNPVHSGPQFEVIYSGSQRGAFELFLQPESSVTGTTWQKTLYMQSPSTFSKPS